MGYLTVNGYLLTYSEYKECIQKYKENGLVQFKSIYDAHKGRYIEQEDLHWGEEIEYVVFFYSPEEKFKLYSDAFAHIEQFNSEHRGELIHLNPEFGNWMVEAVPSKPYGSPLKPSELLSAFELLRQRRQLISDYFTLSGAALASLSSPLILGTKDHILIKDERVQKLIDEAKGDLQLVNQASRSQFILDEYANPHPRFKGLM